MQQELKSEITKQHIVHAAFNLFYENGLKATSINDVMKAAKMTKGAFYHHYKNKEQLALEVIKLKIQKRVYDGMIAPLQQNGNAVEILETTFVNRIKSFPNHEKLHGCPMNNFINEIGDYEKSYQLALKGIVEKWKSALVDFIEKGKADGSIKNEVNSEAAAVFLISSFEGIRGIRKLYNDDHLINNYVEAIINYLNHIKV